MKPKEHGKAPYRRSPLESAGARCSWWERRNSPPPPLRWAGGLRRRWCCPGGLGWETSAANSAEDQDGAWVSECVWLWQQAGRLERESKGLRHLADVLQGVGGDGEVDRGGADVCFLGLEMIRNELLEITSVLMEQIQRVCRVTEWVHFPNLTVHDELAAPAEVFGQQGALQVAAESVLHATTNIWATLEFWPSQSGAWLKIRRTILDKCRETARTEADGNTAHVLVLCANLDVDEDPVVSLIQSFVAFGIEGELERDLGLASWDLAGLGHLDVAADQRDGLQKQRQMQSVDLQSNQDNQTSPNKDSTTRKEVGTFWPQLFEHISLLISFRLTLTEL